MFDEVGQNDYDVGEERARNEAIEDLFCLYRQLEKGYEIGSEELKEAISWDFLRFRSGGVC